MTDNPLYTFRLPYSRKLSRENTFTNFAILEPPTKVFSTKFERTVPTYDSFSIPQHFLCEMITLTDLQKFSPLKVFTWLMYCIGTVRIFEGCLECYKAKINEGSLSLALAKTSKFVSLSCLLWRFSVHNFSHKW